MNKSLRRLIKVLILNIHEIFRNFVPRVALRPVPGWESTLGTRLGLPLFQQLSFP